MNFDNPDLNYFTGVKTLDGFWPYIAGIFAAGGLVSQAKVSVHTTGKANLIVFYTDGVSPGIHILTMFSPFRAHLGKNLLLGSRSLAANGSSFR